MRAGSRPPESHCLAGREKRATVNRLPLCRDRLFTRVEKNKISGASLIAALSAPRQAAPRVAIRVYPRANVTFGVPLAPTSTSAVKLEEGYVTNGVVIKNPTRATPLSPLLWHSGRRWESVESFFLGSNRQESQIYRALLLLLVPLFFSSTSLIAAVMNSFPRTY